MHNAIMLYRQFVRRWSASCALSFVAINRALNPLCSSNCFHSWPNLIDLLIDCVLEQGTTHNEAMGAGEFHKPFAITITVTKPVFPHHMSEQNLIMVHLGIQIIHNDHNITFRKSLRDCIQLLIEKLLSSISQVSVGA